ncbi:SWIM zinc finger family protein [Gordonia sp. CPCC 205333]|uniref:SWIM zinc finger family protein n=1 Tax=Gordonia sp. CPCC 205333 TaxID=3140790 RepID=UPI003AF3A801
MNEFGYTAWGKDFLRLAEPLASNRPESMLPRARSIARNGGVTVTFDGCEARATVHRGSEASVVSVEFGAMTRELSSALAELTTAPDNLGDGDHRTLLDAGQSPAPTLAGSDCSCRARSARCLHLLAVLYTVTRHVDETPVLALTLQGYGRESADATDHGGPAPRWLPINEIDPQAFYGD